MTEKISASYLLLRGWLGRLAAIGSSTFVLTVLFLMLFDVGLREIQPLRYLNHTGLTTIHQNSLVSKLPVALADPRQADVLLMGSSLMLFPCVRCDDEYHGVKTRYDRWYMRNHLFEYNKAEYLEHLLSNRLGQKVQISNVSVAAAMISDQYLILKKYLASGKRPKLIVLTVAPRDFLDNQRAEVEKTPTYSILADFTCLSDLLSHHPSYQELATFSLGSVSTLYKNRADYNKFWTNLTSTLTAHPTTLYTAQMKNDVKGNLELVEGEESVLGFARPDYGPKKNALAELDNYKTIYLPINEKCFQTQSEYLSKLLALAKEDRVPVLIVQMPLTGANIELLPIRARQRYSDTLAQSAARYGAKLCSPGDAQQYGLDDFEDCAHLNSQGGKKLFNCLVSELAGDRRMAQTLTSAGTRVGFFPKWTLFF